MEGFKKPLFCFLVAFFGSFHEERNIHARGACGIRKVKQSVIVLTRKETSMQRGDWRNGMGSKFRKSAKTRQAGSVEAIYGRQWMRSWKVCGG